MPLFLAVKNDDVLSRRGTADFLEGVRRDLFARLKSLPPGDECRLLKGVTETLDTELAFEDAFGQDFPRLLAETETATDVNGLIDLQRQLAEKAADYFHQRGSVPAFDILCTTLTDYLTRGALRLAFRWMEEHGPAAPGVAWAWLAIGALGRGEAGLSGVADFAVIHDGEAPEETSFMVGLAGRAAGILERLGLASPGGVTPVGAAWRGSMTDWRKRITSRVTEGDGDLGWLIGLSDLRCVAGDSTLADGMNNLVRSMLAFHRDQFRETARRISMMPSGFDFFGRFRTERVGESRGMFNLGYYGISPLVANVRVLAVHAEIQETGTIERIRTLLREGHMDVELAERLLRTCHSFGRMRAGMGGEAPGIYVDTAGLSEREEDELKAGIEAVGNLQRLVYTTIAGQG